jgi:hypothetical protein
MHLDEEFDDDSIIIIKISQILTESRVLLFPLIVLCIYLFIYQTLFLVVVVVVVVGECCKQEERQEGRQDEWSMVVCGGSCLQSSQ